MKKTTQLFQLQSQSSMLKLSSRGISKYWQGERLRYRRLLIVFSLALAVSCSLQNRGTFSKTGGFLPVKSAAQLVQSQIVELEYPDTLTSSDKIAVSFGDATVNCHYSPSEEPSHLVFVCAEGRQVASEVGVGSLPKAGPSSLWIPDGRAITHLWVNGSLFSCHSTSPSRVACPTLVSSRNVSPRSN
ncbi:MAG: hypothetical protein ACKOA8_07165 [Deltaproteobacteria bacterium]